MHKLTLDELQSKELRILNCFNEFCGKNNLLYFLAYGTLLGAIRHKGFIPWDDDIDVCMPRPDYERFLKIRDDFENSYTCYAVKTCGDKGFPFSFTKIEDKNTIVHEHCMTKKIQTGVWIDVFPFDGFENDISKNEFLYKNERIYVKIIQKSLAVPGKIGGSSLRRALNFILVPLCRLYVQLFKISQKSNAIAKKNDYENCELVGILLWGEDGIRNIMQKRNIFPLATAEFCGNFYPVPRKPEIYLTQFYGDYMQLPSEDKRITHLEDAWEL